MEGNGITVRGGVISGGGEGVISGGRARGNIRREGRGVISGGKGEG